MRPARPLHEASAATQRLAAGARLRFLRGLDDAPVDVAVALGRESLRLQPFAPSCTWPQEEVGPVTGNPAPAGGHAPRPAPASPGRRRARDAGAAPRTTLGTSRSTARPRGN